MPPERVFVDANVLVSASAFRGNERELLRLAVEGRITLVIADVVYRETLRVLRKKFPARVRAFEYVMALLDCEIAGDPPPGLLAEASEIVRDPGDIAVLASILVSNPDVALTGDKDLLTDEVRAIAPTCRCAEYLQKRND